MLANQKKQRRRQPETHLEGTRYHDEQIFVGTTGIRKTDCLAETR